MQLNYNYVKTIIVTLMQLICNYHGDINLTSIFIDPLKFDTWHYGDFLVNFFPFSTIHYNCSFTL
jgi:hypothetical protein